MRRNKIPPLRLFKHLKSEYAQQLLREGRFRLGTLNEFRALDNDSTRGDKHDGVSRVRHTDRVHDDNYDNQPGFFKATVPFPPGKNVLYERNEIKFDEYSRDCYVYCVSESPGRSVSEQFGTDSVVEITQPQKFLYLMAKALSEEIGEDFGFGCGKCVYVPRVDYRILSDVPRGLIKEPRFGWQREWRMVFAPNDPNQPITPCLLTSRNIAECVRIVSPGEGSSQART